MMSCILTQENERRALLVFKREQLLYDIRNISYIEGDILERPQYHQRQVIQDVGEYGNVDRVTRVINLAVAQCREALYPFTRKYIDNEVQEDNLENPDRYYILVNVPDDFSQTTLELLEHLLHEYIVCRVLYDWFTMTKPEKAEIWKIKADEALTETRGRLHVKIARTRRRCHPF